MPEDKNIYSYYTNLLDDAVSNQGDYADSIPTLQYYTDALNQPTETPDRDYSYYEAEAKEKATAEVQESRVNPDLYGFVPGEWLPDWVKSGYNSSIEGLGYQIATGREFYDLKGYEETNPGVLEDIGSTIVSFLTPTDMAAMVFGGGVGGLGARAVAKAGAREAIEAGVKTGLKSGLAKEAVEKLVSKNAVQATQLLMKNNVKKEVAEKVIADASKKVSNKIYVEATQGATGLGFYSGLQSSLGQEVQSGDISLVQTLADASKGAILGGVTAGTGKAFNNYLIGKLGKSGTKTEALTRNIAVKALEVAEFGTLAPALQGDMPRPEDYIHAAGVIGGLTITKAVPKKVKELAGFESGLLTAKEGAFESAEVEYGIKRQEQVFRSKDGVELTEVTFGKKKTKDGKEVDTVKGKLVVDGEATSKEIEISGKDFTERGFSRTRTEADLKGIESGRRKEAFGRKTKLKISDEEFRAEVEGVTGKEVDAKKHKTGWSQLTQIEQIKLLDNLRKQSLSEKIFQEFKNEGYEDYLFPKRKISKIIPEFIRQAKNRARTAPGKQTNIDINRADARGITLSGLWLQSLADKGLYRGGMFGKIFGNFKINTPDGVKVIRTEKKAKEYFEDLGRRMGKEAHQENPDVVAMREVMDNIFATAEKSGVPVAGKRKNYFPNHIRTEFLDKIGQDIFKIINEDSSFAGSRMNKDISVIDKLKRVLSSESAGFSSETMEALNAYQSQFVKKGLSPDEAMARAWMELRNNVYKQRYSIVGNLEKSREVELPDFMYERDARIVLSKYATDVAKRVAHVEFFGDKSQVIEGRLSTLDRLMKKNSGNPEIYNLLAKEKKWLDQTFDTFANLIEVDPTKNWGDPRARKFFKDLVDFEVGTKIGLGYATIPNVTQTLISTAVKAGYYNTFKAAFKLARPTEKGKQYRNLVRESGISNLSVFQMLAGLEPTDALMGRFANLTTKLSGFQSMNKANQYLAAAAGKEYLNTLMKAKDSKIGWRRSWAEKSLKDLDISTTSNKLTERQTLESMYRFSRDAQLQRNVLNDPLFFNDPRFRPFVLFKRFGYKQFNWVRENMAQELSRGNVLPLLRLGVGGFLGAQFVTWSKKALNAFLAQEEVYDENRLFLPGLPPGTVLDTMGNDINTDMSEYTWGDFLDHAASVGAFGFIADIAAAENKLRAVEFFVKPAIYQDAMKAVDALVRIKNDLDDFGMGAGKRSVKYLAPLLGTAPRRIAKQFETPGQRETYTTYRRGIIRGRVLDALIDGKDKEASKIIMAWNRANPYDAFFYEDIGVDAIFDRLEKKYEKRAKP